MTMIRWRLRRKSKAGPYVITFNGRRLEFLVDENGEFETDGLTELPLYIFATRVNRRWRQTDEPKATPVAKEVK